MQGKVLIAEKSSSGHRLVYVRLLIEGVLERGLVPILAAPPSVLLSDEYARHLESLLEGIQILTTAENPTVRQLQALALNSGANRLIVPDGNSHLLELAFGSGGPKSVSTRVLMMRDPRWEYVGRRVPPIRALAKRFVSRAAELRSVAEIFWLREPGHASDIRHANDPVILDQTLDKIQDLSVPYRQSQGLTEDIYWFGIAGVITDSKQVPTIVGAAAVAGRYLDKKVGVALLGPWRLSAHTENELDQILAQTNLPIVMNKSLHSNLEMNVAIYSVDCIVAAYGNVYGPSSTLGKAAMMGIPSIGAGSKSQQHFIEMITGYPGVSIDQHDITIQMIDRIQGNAPDIREDFGPEQFLRSLLD